MDFNLWPMPSRAAFKVDSTASKPQLDTLAAAQALHGSHAQQGGKSQKDSISPLYTPNCFQPYLLLLMCPQVNNP